MARKRSLAGQLLSVYQQRQKEKAAERKRQQQEELRRARAAEQERQRQERAEAQAAREQARAWEQARKAAEKEQADRARKAEQVVRDLERRQTERDRAAAQRRKAGERAARETEKAAKVRAVEAARTEAERRTRGVLDRLEQLETILHRRAGGLHAHRLPAEAAFADEGADGLVAVLERALAQVDHPEGLRGALRLAFVPETRELMLELDLPGQDVVPAAAGYRYRASPAPGGVVPQPRKPAETKALYQALVARMALRAIGDAFAVAPPALVDVVAFNGHVRSKDKATGKPIRPCLVSLRSTRGTFDDLVLDEPELDPVACLHHLNAIVSAHPYDLEPVRPVATFDLGKYKLAPEVDVVAGLDSRPDLVTLDPIEFEHLIRRLFEAIGLKAWVTQASRDDGVDAVATNEDPITGGLCIIQAKRTKNAVPAEAVRALAGVMHDKAAAKGILVTTGWFGRTSKDFAYRTGRMELIDGRGLKSLLLEHLGIDALIGLPKVPPGWEARDLT
ncbi:restriction endonuclease [Streptomyces sudanensis]|uniref:restriction endonuclease n=1 Tax=Streptomyces sudanensis TaxID=436397 RepID=UPI0020CC2B5B|nr:restriction endonuclease [Streptomyces sudanensis]MCP9956120.1 restriction endonuclease [Streptomyces sudanensis]MCQ0003241.1 restriction endonuclease [Streptomyces sudanensis]